MNITGTEIPERTSFRFNSIPDMPPKSISITRHPASPGLTVKKGFRAFENTDIEIVCLQQSLDRSRHAGVIANDEYGSYR